MRDVLVGSLFILLLAPQIGSAQLIGPNTSLLDQVFMSAQYKENLKYAPSELELRKNCFSYFKSSRDSWKESSKKDGQGFLIEGSMTDVFSKDEILKMGNVNPHGLLSKVRGTDKYITGGYSNINSPGFPHSKIGCEKLYKEEVVIKEIEGKSCREVKMTFNDEPTEYYYQVYCENDRALKIKFAPVKADNDCVHCR